MNGTDYGAVIGQSVTLERTGKPFTALREAKRLLQRADGNTKPAVVAELLTQIAWFSLQLGLPDEGWKAAAAARRMWAGLGNVAGEAMVSSVMSWLLLEMALVDEGFKEAARAVDLAQGQDDPKVLAFAQNAKATTLMHCRQDQLALPLLGEALQAIALLDAPSLRALLMVNVGYSQTSLAETAESEGDAAAGKEWRLKAIASNDQAIALAAECGDLWDLRTALCNGAEYHACLGDTATGQAYLDHWQMLPGEVGLRDRIHYLNTRGELLTKAGRLQDALEVCLEAATIAEQHSYADQKADTARRLSEVYEAMGVHAKALDYHKRFHTAFHAQMGELTRRRAQHVEAELETEKLRTEAALFRTQAQQDQLTGLPNRRSFDARISELGNSPYCVGILDLDHFKAVNDRYSHIVGDAVLRRIALLLGADQRVAAYRFGGEEFALIFTGLGLEAAAKRAEHVRRAIKSFDWTREAPRLAVTASIGIASSAEMRMPELMSLADRRLYAAKAGGRNRVVAADDAGLAARSA